MNFNTVENHQQPPPIDHILSTPIILSDRIHHAITNSKSHQLECTHLLNLLTPLSQLLRSFVRFTNSTPSFYDRPVRRVFADVTTTLNRTLTLLRKCRRTTFILRVVSIVSYTTEFKRIFSLLEASIANMNWLVSIFNDVELSLPPILSNDPIIAWVWSYISSLYNVSISLHVKIDVVNALCSLAIDNNRNKEIIVHEGGVTPLLKLMKEDSSPEAQISTANTLFHLVNNQIRSTLVTNELGVPIIGNCFQKSSTRVQISIARLVARMAENDEVSQEAFARENMIRMLVSLLSFETFVGDEIQSVYSLVEINKHCFYTTSWSINRKERQNESSDLKYELKTCCAKALWMLVRGNLTNSKILTDTKGLIILAKLIETETGELQTNCLMTVMEITNAAEPNADLRRSAFKTNSPAAKAVVEQLLKLINNSENSGIMISAIRSLGSLARTFPARETHVIFSLVKQLGHNNHEIGTESVIALTKFVSPENFLCTEHSKTIIEFDGVKSLMGLLRVNERTQYHALVILCYLAMHLSNSEVLVKAGVLTALEGVDKSIVGQHSQLKELIVQALYHLNMYHTEVHSQRF